MRRGNICFIFYNSLCCMAAREQKSEDGTVVKIHEEMTKKFALLPVYTPSNMVYTPYTPVWDRERIAYSVRPPVFTDLVPKVYQIDNKICGPCSVKMTLQFPEMPNESVNFPLQLVDYCQLASDKCYTMDDCFECDAYNKTVYAHNEFIVMLLTEIMRLNGCKTSAGRVTQVGMPEMSALSQYWKFVEDFSKDSSQRMAYAISYLNSKMLLLPIQSYPLDDAIDLSDLISYFRGVVKRIIAEESYTLHMRFPYEPPVEWNGIETKTIMSGDLKWIMSKKHCCKFPICKACAVSDQKVMYEGDMEELKPRIPLFGNCDSLTSFLSFIQSRDSLTSVQQNIISYVFKGVPEKLTRLIFDLAGETFSKVSAPSKIAPRICEVKKPEQVHTTRVQETKPTNTSLNCMFGNIAQVMGA
ncbi:MAG: hypothetical protein PHN45_00890, partial [Methylococcales bacterium]|nr:hypothetical protein [Methylococcales bacterium]